MATNRHEIAMKSPLVYTGDLESPQKIAAKIACVNGPLQVLRIICIDDSYAKFISPVVQIYLAVLAIANSFTENYV